MPQPQPFTFDLNAGIKADLAACMRTATGTAAAYIIELAIELDLSDDPCDVTSLAEAIRAAGINGGDARAMAREALRLVNSL